MNKDLQNYTFLMIFPNGTVFEGKKLPNADNHYKILENMRNVYPDFAFLTHNYDFQNHKHHVKLYNQLVLDGAIVYQSWSTFIEEDTYDANIYLPNEITLTQKNIMDSILEQLSIIPNVVPYELGDRGYLEISNYELSKGASYVEGYLNQHLSKSK